MKKYTLLVKTEKGPMTYKVEGKGTKQVVIDWAKRNWAWNLRGKLVESGKVSGSLGYVHFVVYGINNGKNEYKTYFIQ